MKINRFNENKHEEKNEYYLIHERDGYFINPDEGQEYPHYDSHDLKDVVRYYLEMYLEDEKYYGSFENFENQFYMKGQRKPTNL